ncbi:MAG TPA: acyltransferase [Dongiaceae bacterium]|jgi:peptidoglycan/LPS O-acetylase OafA/YrhL|nr:acyltransferase [Dongiaceae bacterium]
MFGTFRFVLALMVVYQHYIEVRFAGYLAVFSFYCLSGYLMTRVINEVYADGLSGFGRYLLNRALRIYPCYYAALGIAIAAIAAWPETALSVAPALGWPDQLWPSFTIIGLAPPRDGPLFVLPAWSLHVELIHYIAIGALLGRSRMATLIWLVGAIAVPLIQWKIFGMPIGWSYFTPQGSTIAFAVGACLYHFGNILPSLDRLPIWALLMIVPTIGIVFPSQIIPSSWVYSAVPIAVIAILALRNRPQRPWDEVLGEFAYPIFLLHVPSLVIARGVLGTDDLGAAPFALALTATLSWLALLVIDRPIQRIRAITRRRREDGSKIAQLSR